MSHLGLLHFCRHNTCRPMHLRLQGLLRPSLGCRQAVGQQQAVSCGDAAGHLLQQGQLSLQHGLAAGPVLMLTQVVVPALPAAKHTAQEVSLSSQMVGGIKPSHAGNIVCLQHATSWCLSLSRCLRLVMLLASAGPQLTGACSTALLRTSAGMSRVS